MVTTAHELGIRSSLNDDVRARRQSQALGGHLRLLARLQDQTGGFTEFVALPFIHHNAPIYLAGLARPGPTMRDNVASMRWRGCCCTVAIDQHPVLVGEARR